jgi:hypothetical protein
MPAICASEFDHNVRPDQKGSLVARHSRNTPGQTVRDPGAFQSPGLNFPQSKTAYLKMKWPRALRDHSNLGGSAANYLAGGSWV